MNRTLCCGADLHSNCFDLVSGPCPICQIEWSSDRQPIMEAMDNSLCAYYRKVNELNRRCFSHYFIDVNPVTRIATDTSLPFSESAWLDCTQNNTLIQASVCVILYGFMYMCLFLVWWTPSTVSSLQVCVISLYNSYTVCTRRQVWVYVCVFVSSVMDSIHCFFTCSLCYFTL